MRTVTGPDVICGVVNHSGSYWIEFDIAFTDEEVRPGLNQAGFESSFEQSAGALVSNIAISYVEPAKVLHAFRN